MKLKISCFFFIFILIWTPLPTYAQNEVVVPILLYHCIEESYSEENSNLAITKGAFWMHMRTLKESGFTPISFDEYYDFAKNGKNLPQKPIMITFDDGYLSNYEVAYPILKEFGFQATIFISVSTVGITDDIAYPHFSWEQAREMEESGLIEIGSHTYYHKDMRAYTTDQIQKDLRLSKYLIDTNLNKDCDLFAYPFGFYTPQTQSLAENAGYKIQCIVGDTGANTLHTPINRLKRLTVNGNFSPEQLLDMIETNCRLEL